MLRTTAVRQDRRRTLLGVLGLVAAVLASGCGAGGKEETAPAQLVVEGLAFPPLTVAPGTELALVNRDDEPHTVTATDGSFGSEPFTKDEPKTLKAPEKPGQYPYACTVHPVMKGTLIVK